MRVIFLEDLERQFDAVLSAAKLLCTKEELLAYDETPNRKGNPKRVCNASVIYCREYKKLLRLRGTFFHVPGGARSIIRRAARAWKDLDPAEKKVFELAAELMNVRFQRDHPTYKYQPEKKIRRQQHNINRAPADMQPNGEPATAPSSIPGEEPATAPGGGGPAMPGRGLTGLPSPGTPPLQLMPHTTQTDQNATNQPLPHTTTQIFNISSSSNMTSPQYYYPSPQENSEPTGSDALSILSSPSDEYLPSPLTPDSATYDEPGTPDAMLGVQIYPNLSDIEVVLQEATIITENQEEIQQESNRISEVEITTEVEFTTEGEFDRLFGTGHFDYLGNIDGPLF